MHRKRKNLILYLAMFLVILLKMQIISFAHSEDYPVLSDESGILTSRDATVVEIEEKTLDMYDIYLYVNLSTEGESFQSTTDSLAYDLYSEVFSQNEHGVVIVYTFYDEFKGYYSIKVGKDTNLDVKKMEDIIEKGFNKYGTESEWITETYKEIINYVSKIEKKEIKTEQREQRIIERESRPRTFNPYFAFGAFLIVFIVAIIATLNHIKNKVVIEAQKEELDDQLESLIQKEKELGEVKDGFIDAVNAVGMLSDWIDSNTTKEDFQNQESNK